MMNYVLAVLLPVGAVMGLAFMGISVGVFGAAAIGFLGSIGILKLTGSF